MKVSFEEALTDPRSAFSHPSEVLDEPALDLTQKRRLLLRWEADAVRLQESEAEGFGGGERSQMDAVQQALKALE